MGSKKDLPQKLRVEAGYYFESLQNAQRALKKRLRRGWSKENSIVVLARMHRLTYASARREGVRHW